MSFVETPISTRFLSQDDRIEIADGRARGEPVKQIAARISKPYQTVHRELARNQKTDGRYQPWFAHNQAHLRRRRPKTRRFAADAALRQTVAVKLGKRRSPAQISRWLRRRFPRRRDWHVCGETIYEAVYRGLILPVSRDNLRTGRTYRRRRGRGRTRDGALRQSTYMKSIHDRRAAVGSRKQAGHWEGDLIIGAAQQSAIVTLVERKFRTHDLRLERCIGVAGHLDLDRSYLGQHRLRPNPVTGVAAVAADRVVLVVAQMGRHLHIWDELWTRRVRVGPAGRSPNRSARAASSAG